MLLIDEALLEEYKKLLRRDYGVGPDYYPNYIFLFSDEVFETPAFRLVKERHCNNVESLFEEIKHEYVRCLTVLNDFPEALYQVACTVAPWHPFNAAHLTIFLRDCGSNILQNCFACGNSFHHTLTEKLEGYTHRIPVPRLDTVHVCTSCLGNPTYVSLCSRCDKLTIHNYTSWQRTPRGFCYNCDTSCQNCGSRTHRENNRNYFYYCDSCNLRIKNIPVRNYSFQPPVAFLAHEKEDNPLLFGVEIELESKLLDRETIVALATEQGNGWLYCKDDSSIDHGIEVVSLPFSYAFYQNKPELFSPIFKLRNYQCHAKSTDTCGMHVHLSLSKFSQFHLLKFISLFYDNEHFTLALSERTLDDLRDWASVQLGRRPNTKQKEKIRRAKNAGIINSVERHTAVNTSNPRTVEVRIFKGTLSPVFFKANIEICHAAFYYTKNESMQSISPDSFIRYIKTNKFMYPNLMQKITSLNKRKKL